MVFWDVILCSLADSSISKEIAFSILRVEEKAMWSSGSLHVVEFEVIMLQKFWLEKNGMVLTLPWQQQCLSRHVLSSLTVECTWGRSTVTLGCCWAFKECDKGPFGHSWKPGSVVAKMIAHWLLCCHLNTYYGLLRNLSMEVWGGGWVPQCDIPRHTFCWAHAKIFKSTRSLHLWTHIDS